MLLWLPLATALGLLAVWLWITFRTISLWTTQYEAAWKWLFLSGGVSVLCALFVALLFPRKPARGVKIATASVCLMALIVCVLYFANTRVVSYEVCDVEGRPLENIPIRVAHYANRVVLTGFPGETVLRTDKDGHAAIRIFKNEEWRANVNDVAGGNPELGNSTYSEENVFFASVSPESRGTEWPYKQHEVLEHTYVLKAPPWHVIYQRCMEPVINLASVRIYLSRRDSFALPPYYAHIINLNSTDTDIQDARLMSLGGSIEGFNHLEELLAAALRDDSRQDIAIHSLSLLADQIYWISNNLPELSLEGPKLGRPYGWREEREKYSQMLYVWLSGNTSPPPLSHHERIAYIGQRIDQAARQIIEAIHPLMLKKKGAFEVLQNLDKEARPAMKFYPEVFEKGTAAAQQGALGALDRILPPAEDVAFLLRSKNPTWINNAMIICTNSSAAELAHNIKIFEGLKAEEKDPQNIAAFARAIDLATNELTEHRSSDEDTWPSKETPRYVVIDLGTNLLHPKKVTNSGYVLGYNNSNYYVWCNGVETALQPKFAGDVISVDDIDETGTAVGTEKGAGPTGEFHGSVSAAIWEKGSSAPRLATASTSASGSVQTQLGSLKLPQIPNSQVVPLAMNASIAPWPSDDKPISQLARLVSAMQVIGNGPAGGYLWEMTPNPSAEKIFEGPVPINDLLPGYPTPSPWNVTSVASINDGGAIVGTAIYKPTDSTDKIAAGAHGAMLVPLAIVRETTPGSGDFEPIVDNGLDDHATLPTFASELSVEPNMPHSNPETDGQGIFYIQMPGTVPTDITLTSGSKTITVQATPVRGWPNLLRTGKLVLIVPGDPFRAPDIATLEAGGSGVQLQEYKRTIVK